MYTIEGLPAARMPHPNGGRTMDGLCPPPPNLPIQPPNDRQPALGFPENSQTPPPTNSAANHRPLVLHLDVDAFFAAIEQRDDPRLRGKPVAVGTGVVASCSYEARRHGVRTAMRLREAKALCPSLRVLPGDYRRYEVAGRQIAGLCNDITRRVEVAALDDLYLQIPDIIDPYSPDQPIRLADNLRARVRAEVGLEVSVGMARGRFIAGVATHDAKECRRELAARCQGTPPPSPTRLVPPGAERGFLAPFPSSLLPGAGSLNARRLAECGLATLGDVALAPRRLLEGLFGAPGRLWSGLAAGDDDTLPRVDKPAATLSRGTSLEPPLADRPGGHLRALLDYLVTRAALELRARGRLASGLRVHVRYGDYAAADGLAKLSPPANDDATLRAAAHDRLTRVLNRRLPLRYIGVEFTGLAPAAPQLQLFTEPAAERGRKLDACADAIRARFGFLAIRPGATLVLDGQFTHDQENYHLRTPCLTR